MGVGGAFACTDTCLDKGAKTLAKIIAHRWKDWTYMWTYMNTNAAQSIKHLNVSYDTSAHSCQRPRLCGGFSKMRTGWNSVSCIILYNSLNVTLHLSMDGLDSLRQATHGKLQRCGTEAQTHDSRMRTLLQYHITRSWDTPQSKNLAYKIPE
jgi:hypothetical protein